MIFAWLFFVFLLRISRPKGMTQALFEVEEAKGQTGLA